MNSYLTVNDLLQRKHFENIEVVAGHNGLSRMVKWVHVVDVTKIRNLLNGNELILSTGLAWKEDKELFLSVVEQLIDSNAAGLCIEIGTYTTLLPTEIIELANEHHFPIILFKQEVPFVEITQDIHTLLINHQYQMISDLEGYSQALNKKLLTIEDHNEILTFIQQYLKIQVITIFSNHEIQFTPKVTEKEQGEILNIIESHAMGSPSPLLASIPIQLLGDNHAELIILSKDRALTDFDQLILDRTATALAQFLLRKHYVEEKRRAEETEWLMSWLEGEYGEESIQEYLAYHSPAVKPKGAFVCLCKLNPYE
ncbi:MAG: PucR family transcriptional regulator ligand-binding domain-containing protein, partial [Mesobacillus sp.]|uniref:PucR family transcriptional regulator ligand-binding domain-containing protein n=1 Tax=Mesobacillus sp. TaxID=2675271 RepID=UPI003C5A959D